MKDLSPRQAEVAAKVAQGLSTKQVAAELGLSVETVKQHIQDAARRLPGTSYPRHRLTLWFLQVADD